MPRIIWTMSALFCLAIANPARSADVPPAGAWKLSVYQEGQLQTLWIIELKSKDNQWTGSVVASPKGMPKAKLEGLQVTEDLLRFTLKIENQVLAFEGKVPK